MRNSIMWNCIVLMPMLKLSSISPTNIRHNRQIDISPTSSIFAHGNFKDTSEAVFIFGEQSASKVALLKALGNDDNNDNQENEEQDMEPDADYYPKEAIDPETSIVFYSCPQLSSSKGLEHSLMVHFFMGKLLKSVESLKSIFEIDLMHLDPEGSHDMFANLLSSISSTFVDLSKYQNSMLLVVTQSTQNADGLNSINEFLNKFLEHLKSSDSDANFIPITEIFLNPDNLILFPNADIEGSGDYIQEARDKIIERLNEIQAVPILEGDLSFKTSSSNSEEIEKLLATIDLEISNLIQQTTKQISESTSQLVNSEESLQPQMMKLQKSRENLENLKATIMEAENPIKVLENLRNAAENLDIEMDFSDLLRMKELYAFQTSIKQFANIPLESNVPLDWTNIITEDTLSLSKSIQFLEFLSDLSSESKDIIELWEKDVSTPSGRNFEDPDQSSLIQSIVQFSIEQNNSFIKHQALTQEPLNQAELVKWRSFNSDRNLEYKVYGKTVVVIGTNIKLNSQVISSATSKSKNSDTIAVFATDRIDMVENLQIKDKSLVLIAPTVSSGSVIIELMGSDGARESYGARHRLNFPCEDLKPTILLEPPHLHRLKITHQLCTPNYEGRPTDIGDDGENGGNFFVFALTAENSKLKVRSLGGNGGAGGSGRQFEIYSLADDGLGDKNIPLEGFSFSDSKNPETSYAKKDLVFIYKELAIPQAMATMVYKGRDGGFGGFGGKGGYLRTFSLNTDKDTANANYHSQRGWNGDGGEGGTCFAMIQKWEFNNTSVSTGITDRYLCHSYAYKSCEPFWGGDYGFSKGSRGNKYFREDILENPGDPKNYEYINHYFQFDKNLMCCLNSWKRSPFGTKEGDGKLNTYYAEYADRYVPPTSPDIPISEYVAIYKEIMNSKVENNKGLQKLFMHLSTSDELVKFGSVKDLSSQLLRVSKLRFSSKPTASTLIPLYSELIGKLHYFLAIKAVSKPYSNCPEICTPSKSKGVISCANYNSNSEAVINDGERTKSYYRKKEKNYNLPICTYGERQEEILGENQIVLLLLLSNAYLERDSLSILNDNSLVLDPLKYLENLQEQIQSSINENTFDIYYQEFDQKLNAGNQFIQNVLMPDIKRQFKKLEIETTGLKNNIKKFISDTIKDKTFLNDLRDMYKKNAIGTIITSVANVVGGVLLVTGEPISMSIGAGLVIGGSIAAQFYKPLIDIEKANKELYDKYKALGKNLDNFIGNLLRFNHQELTAALQTLTKIILKSGASKDKKNKFNELLSKYHVVAATNDLIATRTAALAITDFVDKMNSRSLEQDSEDETAVEIGDGTGVEIGDGTKVEIGDETGVEIGDGTKVEIGDETGVEIGDGTKVEIGDETGVEIGNNNTEIEIGETRRKRQEIITPLQATGAIKALVDQIPFIIKGGRELGNLEIFATVDAEIDKVLAHYRNLQNVIIEFISPMVKDVKALLEKAKHDPSKINAFDPSNWQIKTNLQAVQSIYLQLIRALELDEGNLILIVERIKDSFDTITKTYERMESFSAQQRQIEFQKALSHQDNVLLTHSDPEIKAILKQYKKSSTDLRIKWMFELGINSFKTSIFPFAPYYSEFFLLNINNKDSINKAHVLDKIKKLISKLSFKSNVLSSVNEDSFIKQLTFGFEAGKEPFTTWTHKSSAAEIEDLLSGKEINLVADPVDKYHVNRQAIKFNTIGIQLKVENGQRNKELQTVAKMLRVQMIHGGKSKYRFNGKTYILDGPQLIFSFEYSQTFAVHENRLYSNLKKHFPLISPYTTWKIKLYSDAHDDFQKQAFSKLGKFKGDKIDLMLIGEGSYVGKVNPPLSDKDLEKFYPKAS